MSGFIKKRFIGLLRTLIRGNFGGALVSNSGGQTKCAFLNNRPCQDRPTIVKINCNERLFYSFTVSVKSILEVLILLAIHMLEYMFWIKEKI